ncbi:MAG TPA: hypothetical protein VH858_10280 [Hyphomicrobiales bacterium]|jgi:hypothetical protein
MDKPALLEQLARIEKQIAKGDMVIARQKKVILDLEHNGYTVTDAKRFLRQLEDMHAVNVAQRCKIEVELAETILG